MLEPAEGFDTNVVWWGEKERDVYDRYRRSGLYNWGADPRMYLDYFKRFESYEEMPGMGVCGIYVSRGLRAASQQGRDSGALV